MRTRIVNQWETLRSTFWFIPGLMTIFAMVLSFITVEADHRITADHFRDGEWLWFGGPDGARHMLNAIATSMVTVAGVSFSITIVALTMASAQFGPRLLRNFMRDTGNQLVLGTFISTFVYCLFVMRTIRSVDEVEFVPYASVTIGFFLGVGSVIVLIYFIHHVSAMIQAENLVVAVALELNQGLERMFPETLSGQHAGDDESQTAKCPTEGGASIEAGRSGYLQAIEEETVIDSAVKSDLLVRLMVRSGDFVTRRRIIAVAWPAERVTPQVAAGLRNSFIFGNFRTPTQDVEYSMRQLVEIAVRALSPSLNDPFTAIACLDWLGAALMKVCEREITSTCRYDNDNRLRVVFSTVDFRAIAGACFTEICRYGRNHQVVLVHLLQTLMTVGTNATRNGDRTALLDEARRVVTEAKNSTLSPEALREVEDKAREAIESLQRSAQI